MPNIRKHVVCRDQTVTLVVEHFDKENPDVCKQVQLNDAGVLSLSLFYYGKAAGDRLKKMQSNSEVIKIINLCGEKDFDLFWETLLTAFFGGHK